MERLKRIVFLCITILSLLPGLALATSNEDNTADNSVNWEPVMDAIIQVESGGNRFKSVIIHKTTLNGPYALGMVD